MNGWRLVPMAALEAPLFGHVLVHLPALVLLGVAAARRLPGRLFGR
jgi:uncharacterized protein (DUF983 family)